VGIRESYSPISSAKQTGGAWDYFHANAVDLDADGNLLVSARNTHAVYKVDRRTGKVLWRLGGKRNDFARGPGVHFAWQHDVRRQPDGTITLFDNGAAPPVEKLSRALVLRVDERAKQATLLRSYSLPGLLSPHQGNLQVLPDGHAFVDWGGLPYFAEFSRGGDLLFEAHMNPGSDTYRAFRTPWVGRPTTDPALALRPHGDHVTVYASWNGATEVDRWQVRAGPTRLRLRAVASARRTGFETAIDVRTELPYLSVVALDRRGRILGTSRVRYAPQAA
jgi:hypothetical protein